MTITDSVPELPADELGRWPDTHGAPGDGERPMLRHNRPATYQPGIMHGDYQFANVMYRHGAPAKLAAIVDWDDPLLDVGCTLLGWDGGLSGDGSFYLDLAGMPRRSELLEHHERVSGLSTENIDYYLVSVNWKLGILLEKTDAAAVRSGVMNDKAAVFGRMIPRLIATAAELTRSLPTKEC
jgi:aminoglycoside phosphotransferase (APT) family kinase protein